MNKVYCVQIKQISSITTERNINMVLILSTHTAAFAAFRPAETKENCGGGAYIPWGGYIFC